MPIDPTEAPEASHKSFLDQIEKIETFGAVLTSRSSTANRCVSLAFTKLQEARHWMEQCIRDEQAIAQAQERIQE